MATTKSSRTENAVCADTNNLFSYGATPAVQKPNVANSPCGCGCGQVPNKKGSRYLPGHDGRHKGQLLAQAHAGSEVALATLVSLGWSHFFVPRKAKSS